MLLTVGLLTYSTVPNIHRTAQLKTQPVLDLDRVPVDAAVAYVRNIALNEGSNHLRANFTLLAQRGDLYPLRFQIFSENETTKCSNPLPSSFLINQDITNQSSPNVPINASGDYCFVFDNQASSEPVTKVISASAMLYSNSEQITVSYDGEINMAGLGLGAFGLLVLLYGLWRKTVIPWE